jgi:cephalosporin-C deacetylase-like acetyl esterase
MRTTLRCWFCLFWLIFHSSVRAEPEVFMDNLLKTEAARLDAGFLKGVSSREQWEEQRPRLRQEYLEMLGLWPLPEHTALQAKVTGGVQRDAFRVENLHFQSRPGLYVTGNLYLPADAKAGSKLPAVLYVCGHSGKGRDGNKTAFQHHGMWFATHGYVCLIIDTLQLGEIAAIHHGTYRENRWWWHALGYAPSMVECWNGVRAIDYLQSRPEVDGERIGVTGISGGGAATFWIAAADERVKVAVPVSGMSDLEDYVTGKVVNGHCDCMFLTNTFQWPWTNIAALVAPRPMLFANSGHDTIFPMTGNERIRARLERLYGFYAKRTDTLFDVAVTPGGHDDNPELRLMAYRWLNRHLKNDTGQVSEPELPKIEGKQLRAFPDQLPADEINTKIDRLFISTPVHPVPSDRGAYLVWREKTMTELKRLVFRSLPEASPGASPLLTQGGARRMITLDAGDMPILLNYFPQEQGQAGDSCWLAVLGEGESLETKPEWVTKSLGGAPVLLIAPRGSGMAGWKEPAPYYIARSLPLLGRTMDTCRLGDVLSAARLAVADTATKWKIAGRGQAGVIGAYAALLEPRITEVLAINPPLSHREGPIFLNVLRVVDVPEAFALIAPRTLTIAVPDRAPFVRTEAFYKVAGGALKWQ